MCIHRVFMMLCFISPQRARSQPWCLIIVWYTVLTDSALSTKVSSCFIHSATALQNLRPCIVWLSLAPCLSASYVYRQRCWLIHSSPWSLDFNDSYWHCALALFMTAIPNLSTPCRKMTVHLPLYKTEACYMSQAGHELLPFCPHSLGARILCLPMLNLLFWIL